jgi:hypothetical protein
LGHAQPLTFISRVLGAKWTHSGVVLTVAVLQLMVSKQLQTDKMREVHRAAADLRRTQVGEG